MSGENPPQSPPTIRREGREEGFILGENMKNIIKVLSSLLLLFGGNLYSKSYEKVLSNIVDDLYPKTKEECRALVIFEPEYLDKRKSSSGKAMQEKLIMLFGKKIGNKKGIRVVERNQIDKIYQEYKIKTSGLVDDKSITQIGRMLGADCLLTTTLSDLVDEVEINSRIIKMETGEIVSTASGKIEKENLALWRKKNKLYRGGLCL
jgi:TolB-like protein